MQVDKNFAVIGEVDVTKRHNIVIPQVKIPDGESRIVVLGEMRQNGMCVFYGLARCEFTGNTPRLSEPCLLVKSQDGGGQFWVVVVPRESLDETSLKAPLVWHSEWAGPVTQWLIGLAELHGKVN